MAWWCSVLVWILIVGSMITMIHQSGRINDEIKDDNGYCIALFREYDIVTHFNNFITLINDYIHATTRMLSLLIANINCIISNFDSKSITQICTFSITDDMFYDDSYPPHDDTTAHILLQNDTQASVPTQAFYKSHLMVNTITGNTPNASQITYTINHSYITLFYNIMIIFFYFKMMIYKFIHGCSILINDDISVQGSQFTLLTINEPLNIIVIGTSNNELPHQSLPRGINTAANNSVLDNDETAFSNGGLDLFIDESKSIHRFTNTAHILHVDDNRKEFNAKTMDLIPLSVIFIFFMCTWMKMMKMLVMITMFLCSTIVWHQMILNQLNYDDEDVAILNEIILPYFGAATIPMFKKSYAIMNTIIRKYIQFNKIMTAPLLTKLTRCGPCGEMIFQYFLYQVIHGLLLLHCYNPSNSGTRMQWHNQFNAFFIYIALSIPFIILRDPRIALSIFDTTPHEPAPILVKTRGFANILKFAAIFTLNSPYILIGFATSCCIGPRLSRYHQVQLRYMDFILLLLLLLHIYLILPFHAMHIISCYIFISDIFCIIWFNFTIIAILGIIRCHFKSIFTIYITNNIMIIYCHIIIRTTCAIYITVCYINIIYCNFTTCTGIRSFIAFSPSYFISDVVLMVLSASSAVMSISTINHTMYITTLLHFGLSGAIFILPTFYVLSGGSLTLIDSVAPHASASTLPYILLSALLSTISNTSSGAIKIVSASSTFALRTSTSSMHGLLISPMYFPSSGEPVPIPSLLTTTHGFATLLNVVVAFTLNDIMRGFVFAAMLNIYNYVKVSYLLSTAYFTLPAGTSILTSTLTILAALSYSITDLVWITSDLNIFWISWCYFGDIDSFGIPGAYYLLTIYFNDYIGCIPRWIYPVTC